MNKKKYLNYTLEKLIHKDFVDTVKSIQTKKEGKEFLNRFLVGIK